MLHVNRKTNAVAVHLELTTVLVQIDFTFHYGIHYITHILLTSTYKLPPSPPWGFPTYIHIVGSPANPLYT